MHPTNPPPRERIERDDAARRFAGIAPAAVDVVLAAGKPHGIVAVIEAIGLVALLPLGFAVAGAIGAAIAWLIG